MERKNEGDVGFNHARKTHIIRERLSMNREGDRNRSRGFGSEFARACLHMGEEKSTDACNPRG